MVKVDNVIENLTGYLESRIEILRIDAKKEVARVGTNIAVGIVVGVFGLFILICLTIALGLWLGSLVDSRALGFVLAAGVYLLLTGLVIALRGTLEKSLRKSLFPKYQS